MRNYVKREWYKGKDHRRFSYSKDIDKELVPMLDVFNNIPGVRTVYSCCGHGNPDWYMSFNTTSDFMFHVIHEYFTAKDFEVVTPIEDYINFNLVPERTITVYGKKLGVLDSNERRKEYGKICEFFSKFTPRSSWEAVQEF